MLDGSRIACDTAKESTISTDIYLLYPFMASSLRATLITMTINILDVIDANPFLERLASCSPNTDLVIRSSELSQFTRPILQCLVSAVDYSWTVIANATTQLEKKTISHRVSRMKMRAYVGAYGHLSRDWKCSGCSDKPFCLRGTPDLEYAVDQQLLSSRSIITFSLSIVIQSQTMAVRFLELYWMSEREETMSRQDTRLASQPDDGQSSGRPFRKTEESDFRGQG